MKSVPPSSVATLACCLLSSWTATAGSLNVPNEYPTIQAAIDSASAGDVVSVAAGTYEESIVLKDNVTIMGEGADITIIDSVEAHAVLADGTRSATIEGFTLRGGTSYAVMVQRQSDVVIRRNVITGSSGGIQFYASSGRVVANVFADFPEPDQNAISCMNDSSPEIISNLIIRSTYGIMAYYDSNPLIINNTIVHSNIGIDFRAFFDVATSQPSILNNIIAHSALGIRALNGAVASEIGHNLLWDNQTNYEDVPPPRTDIEVDPLFVDAADDDYHLSGTSPAVDAGIEGYATPFIDNDGNTRPVDGNADGTAQLDIGAFELSLEPSGETDGSSGTNQANESGQPTSNRIAADAGGCNALSLTSLWYILVGLLFLRYRWRSGVSKLRQ